MAEEQPPEVKAEARQFMSDLVSGGDDDFTGSAGAGSGADMNAWRAAFAAKDEPAAGNSTTSSTSPMEQFWSHYYDPSSTSLWTMVYDEADSNENLSDTTQMVRDFMTVGTTESLRSHCFGIVHVLEGLEIEGLWWFNGPDPQELFGANEDTSWYTWTRVGDNSAANELVQKAVDRILAPADGKLNGKAILDTQTF